MHADIAQTVHRMAHTCGVRNYLGGQWCDLGRKANGDAMLADILFQGLYPDDDDTGAKIYGDFTIRKVVGGDGKVSHNDHEDLEGSITNGIKDKAKQYLEAVNDRRVRVDALVINSGGRMSKCLFRHPALRLGEARGYEGARTDGGCRRLGRGSRTSTLHRTC